MLDFSDDKQVKKEDFDKIINGLYNFLLEFDVKN